MARSSSEWYEHALQLAKQHNVRLVMDSTMPLTSSKFLIAARMVLHPPITDEKSYAVVLHELGHAVDPQANRTADFAKATPQERSAIQIEEEEAAWAWAKKNSIEWTKESERAYAFGLATYLHNDVVPDIAPTIIAPTIEQVVHALFSGGAVIGSVQSQPPVDLSKVRELRRQQAATLVVSIQKTLR